MEISFLDDVKRSRDLARTLSRQNQVCSQCTGLKDGGHRQDVKLPSLHGKVKICCRKNQNPKTQRTPSAQGERQQNCLPVLGVIRDFGFALPLRSLTLFFHRLYPESLLLKNLRL
jgi:hypothetical protein